VTDDTLLTFVYLTGKGMSFKITSTHAYTSVGPPPLIPFDWNFPKFLILPTSYMCWRIPVFIVQYQWNDDEVFKGITTRMFCPGAKMAIKFATTWCRNNLPGEKLPQHKWLDVITTSNMISDAYKRDTWQGIMKWLMNV